MRSVPAAAAFLLVLILPATFALPVSRGPVLVKRVVNPPGPPGTSPPRPDPPLNAAAALMTPPGPGALNTIQTQAIPLPTPPNNSANRVPLRVNTGIKPGPSQQSPAVTSPLSTTSKNLQAAQSGQNSPTGPEDPDYYNVPTKNLAPNPAADTKILRKRPRPADPDDVPPPDIPPGTPPKKNPEDIFPKPALKKLRETSPTTATSSAGKVGTAQQLAPQTGTLGQAFTPGAPRR